MKKIFGLIVSLLLFLVMGLLLYGVLSFDILPIKLLIPVVLSLVVIFVLLCFFNFRSIISIVISILFILIFAFAFFLINKTSRFIDDVSNTGEKYENYSVIVLKDSDYTLDSIKKIGYYYNSEQHVDLALDKLSKENVEFSSIDLAAQGLYDSLVPAIILEDTYYNIYCEENSSFKSDTKVIYSFSVSTLSTDIQKQVDVNMEPFSVFISGIDTYGPISSVSRSDVNIIATINPNSNRVLLTTIPRDYYVQLHGTTGLKDKLTHAGIYGVDKSVKTLEDLLDIDINYYVKVNFSSVERIVDTLGGVNVYSKYSFIGFEKTSFNSGYNYVDGARALEFARTRKTVTGGDRTRGMNQEALIEAILKKICSKDIIVKYSSLLDSLDDSFQTNMSRDEITNLIKNIISKGNGFEVESISLDGTNSYQYTYSYGGKELFVIIPDSSTIEYFHERYEDTIK